MQLNNMKYYSHIHNVRLLQYIYRMKRFFIAAASAVLIITAVLCGCSGKMDYTKFISEKRSAIFLYKDDTCDLKINCVSREEPFNSDGICGDMCDLIEVFVSFDRNPETVEISLNGHSGEMNFEAVEQRFSLTFTSPAIEGDGVDVQLTLDGATKSVRALSVLDKGVLSCEEALICAVEHDRALFESLTDRRDFAGEIYIRLLYDDGCYYYVGVCDRDKNITAYLLDGGVGKVIASKKING